MIESPSPSGAAPRPSLLSEAQAAFEARRFGEAASLLQWAVELGNRHPAVMFALAISRSELGEDDRARALVDVGDQLIALFDTSSEGRAVLEGFAAVARAHLPGGSMHPGRRGGSVAGWSTT